MKKVIPFVLSAVVALGVVGCADDTVEVKEQDAPASQTVERASEDERQPLSITESGYWFDDYGTGYYAAIIENPNTNWTAERIALKVSGKDASGNIVGTADDSVTILFPNGKTAISGMCSFTGAETLEFQLVEPSSSQWTEDDVQQADVDAQVFAQNVNEVVDEYGYTTVAGEAVNNSDGSFSLTKACVVFRGADDSVLGGSFAYIGELPKGSTIPFSASLISNVPDHAKVEVYLDYGWPIAE